MHVGDTFRVLRQGSPITDLDTHEIIGYTEAELGKIEVTEVEANLSKAKIVDGNLSQVGDANGLIARRVERAVAEASQAGAPNAGENVAHRYLVPRPNTWLKTEPSKKAS